MEGVTAPSSQVYKVGGEVQRDVDSVSVKKSVKMNCFFSQKMFFSGLLTSFELYIFNDNLEAHR